MTNAQKIFVVGMPLSGKSKLCKEVAKELQLNHSWVDTDDLLVQWYNKKNNCKFTIQSLYHNLPETEFRYLERKVLHSLPIESKLVSCGGGLPCFFDNIDYMLINGIVLFLKEDTEVLFKRAQLNEHLVYQGMQINDLEELYLKRSTYYSRSHRQLNYDDCYHYLMNVLSK